MPISIASYSFYGLLGEGKMDVFGYLETVKYRYGLNTADIWNGILTSTESEYLAKVRAAMEEKELSLVNLCVDGAHLWDPDPEKREQLHQNALANLRAGAILGAKTVRIDMGVRSSDLTNEQFDFLVERYREYIRFADDHGFRIGPENHFGAALIPHYMEKLARTLDHPAYGILLHIGHWDTDELEGDRRAAPYTMHTHVDARITATCLEERMKLLSDAGYRGCWGVEHHSGAHEYAEVGWQLASVKRALAKL